MSKALAAFLSDCYSPTPTRFYKPSLNMPFLNTSMKIYINIQSVFELN